MDLILVFFRDTLSGIWYFLYLALCIFIVFYLLGVVGDRKRAAIAVKLKEKKTYDIESGREAEIAAKQTKQIIGVLEDQAATPNANNPLPGAGDAQNKEEVPTVMVLNSSEQPAQQEQAQPAVTPVVIDSSSIKNE